MKKILLLIITFLIPLSSLVAQISLDGVGTYSQDFNSLANSGTSSSVPSGWSFVESGTIVNTEYTAGTGSSNIGDTYSFGSTSSTDRCFGCLRSGSVTTIIGATFTNNTGSTITQIPVTYVGEQWRAGETNRGAADRLDFQISTDATSLTNGTWINIDALDFTSPNINTSLGLLDGNSAENRSTVSYTIPTLSISNGSTFWIRWTDYDITSSDDGLGIDDFSIDETNLPVELTSFTASTKDKVVNLKWTTKTEVDNYGFEIEKCLTPITSQRKVNYKWDKIGFVPGAGNSNSPRDYSFVDQNISGYGKISYRLKQLDSDGKYEYSKEVEVDFGSIKDFALFQNYPNPFNPSTLISYTIPQAVHVKLSIFSVLGSKVATLVDEFQEAGYYSKEFSSVQNGLNLTNGVYFYKLEAGNFTSTKKFILMK